MHTFKSNDVSKVTLLSLEEAKTLPKEILACGHCWWLRSPGNSDYYAAVVDYYGYLHEEGAIVNLGYIAVRPAFLIPNFKSSNLQIGDTVEVAGIDAIVISDDMALAKKPVGLTAFREDYEKADGANDYNVSDVKKWLEEWWQRVNNNFKTKKGDRRMKGITLIYGISKCMNKEQKN